MNKKVKFETSEEALKRGVKVVKYEEGKIGLRRIKKDNKEAEEEKNKIDVHALLAKCNKEERKKLLEVLKAQGIELDEEEDEHDN